jgi:hypothetical protein
MRRGQLLEIRAERGEVVMTKRIERDPIDEVYGILGTELTTDEIIEQMRGPADLPAESSSPDR